MFLDFILRSELKQCVAQYPHVVVIGTGRWVSHVEKLCSVLSQSSPKPSNGKQKVGISKQVGLSIHVHIINGHMLSFRMPSSKDLYCSCTTEKIVRSCVQEGD